MELQFPKEKLIIRLPNGIFQPIQFSNREKAEVSNLIFELI
jgi:hypothetical protein